MPTFQKAERSDAFLPGFSMENTHVAAKTKFNMAVTPIAPRFAASSGNPTPCLNSHVNNAFDAMDTNPLAT